MSFGHDSTDIIVLSTGKKIYAHQGIIGIGPDLEISQGWDGPVVEIDRPYDESDEIEERELPKEIFLEIADIAIKRWTEFKEKIIWQD